MVLSFLLTMLGQQVSIPEIGVTVFSKTAAFRHDSIPDGIAMFQKLASENAWILTATEDSEELMKSLPRSRVVVFLNTTGDVLNDQQQKQFEDWFRKGNGYVGIHSAADTEYDWAWYGKLVGAYFKRHPAIQKADIIKMDNELPMMKHLPQTWTRTDEWYDYKAAPGKDVRVLGLLNTATYQDSQMGSYHPIIWCHEMEGGRAFYSGLGHTKESYTEKGFVELLRQAILWSARKL